MILVCLALFGAGSAGVMAGKGSFDIDIPEPGQTQFALIVVNGRPLTGPNSSARRRDGRILLPLAAVARALGDTFLIDAGTRTISVHRQTGTAAELDARVGEVRENGATVLAIANAGEIVFSAGADELLLPIEICSALLEISIRYDDTSNTVIIDRGRATTEAARYSVGRGLLEIYQADYEYNANKYSTAFLQNLLLNAAGRLGDGRFSFSSYTNASSTGRVSFGNTAFRLERPNGQRFVAGDFGTGTDLQFVSAMVRGGLAAIPVKSLIVTAFAGRSVSGNTLQLYDPATLVDPAAPVTQVIFRDRFHYDTTIFGAFATNNSGPRRQAFSFIYSAGAMRFSSASRSGTIASASLNYGISRLRLQGDVAFGEFTGIRADRTRFSGPAAAIDLAGTFQATAKLAFQARITQIGADFLSPQSGIREPINLKAAGLTWSAAKWISASFSASTARRPGVDTQNNTFVTASVSLSPASWLPRLYVSHTESKTSQMGSSSFTVLNASKQFSRLRLYLNATQVQSLRTITNNGQFGANYALNERNSFELSQGIGSRGVLSGQFDWRTSGLIDKRLSFTAGVGYNHSVNSGTSPYERVSASLLLPRQTSVQFSYYQTNAGPAMLITVKGSLFRRHEAAAYMGSSVTSMNSLAKASGRVYQDINLDGRYEAGIDVPLPDVKIRIDGNRYVVSDPDGLYRVDSVVAGDHKVYLDLLSVRADLTLLDSAERNQALQAGKDTVTDFRLVRTGRVSGRVWIDENGNGKYDAGEKALADVRVVSSVGRDTLTDADGYFVIGDLPPGQQVILIDAKTLPEKLIPASTPITVSVKPGSETSDVLLSAIETPPEVKRFPARTKE